MKGGQLPPSVLPLSELGAGAEEEVEEVEAVAEAAGGARACGVGSVC